MTYMGPARRKSSSKFFNVGSNLVLAAGLAAGLVGFAACGDSSQSFFADGGDDGTGNDGEGGPFIPADGGLNGTDLGDASVASLYFDPPDATLTVDGTTAVEITSCPVSAACTQPAAMKETWMPCTH